MKQVYLILSVIIFLYGCAPQKVSPENIQQAAESVDFGDFKSSTLASKAWQASAAKDYPELFAYTKKCVELYGDEGKAMNAKLSEFEPRETASKHWALNDAGTCMFIMANAYADLKMYSQAVKSYRSLADDYTYSQCWDPKGWYWRPAEGAEKKIEKYEYLE